MSLNTLSYPDFEILYNRHAEKMYTICMYHLDDEEEAKEIVQSIFVSLWERKDSLAIGSSLEHYLMRAVKLKIFELIRNRATRERKLREASLLQTSKQAHADEELICRDLVLRVNQFIGQLPAQCRTVYRMSREEGMSNKQISAALTLSEKTVEAHLTKALKFLRARLSEFIS